MKAIEHKVNENGCHICTSHKTSKGYPFLYYEGKKTYISRYMYITCKGEIPKGSVIRHTCDNPGCINPKHLILGTYADNSRDMVERNRQAKGSRVNTAKLTQQDVEDILRYPDSTSHTEIAKRYNVNVLNISRIRRGEIWKSVPRPEDYVYTDVRYGEANKSAKLTESKVEQILLATNIPYAELGKEFGVCASTICKIKSGEKWKHVYKRIMRS